MIAVQHHHHRRSEPNNSQRRLALKHTVRATPLLLALATLNYAARRHNPHASAPPALANETNPVAAATHAVKWWLSPWFDTSPQQSTLRQRLHALIDAHSRLRGVSIQLSWKSHTDEFTLAAGHDVVIEQGVPVERKLGTDDLFLFGSGTKPYTAVAILKLVESGRLLLEQPAWPYVDAALLRLGSNQTLAMLLGPAARNVTIAHMLGMSSGIADFDVPSLDADNLRRATDGETVSPVDILSGVARFPKKFVCEPGACVSYSSTNYILLGLVLLALDDSAASWDELDQGSVLPRQDAFQHTAFMNRGPIGDANIVVGHEGKAAGLWPIRGPTVIAAQDSSVLGWTCGNLVSTTREVALFFWQLLVEESIISHATLQHMKELRPLGVGWGSGHISYGLGVMLKQTSFAKHAESGEWGTYLGHGGNTYGFLSEQGLITQLNATFSVAVNANADPLFASGLLSCEIIAIAAEEILGKNLRLACAG